MYANIEIELYEEDGLTYVYLSNDGSSGCKYQIKDKEDFLNQVRFYCDSVWDYESDGDE